MRILLTLTLVLANVPTIAVHAAPTSGEAHDQASQSGTDAITTIGAEARAADSAPPMLGPDAGEPLGRERSSVPLLAPGQRVRVKSPQTGDGWAVARVVHMDEEAIVVRPVGSDGTISLPRASIEELELSVNRRNRSNRGAAVGAAALGIVGALCGAVIGVDHDCPVPAAPTAPYGVDDNYCAQGPSGPGAAVGGGLGLFAGATLGALVGLAASREEWQPVPRRRLVVRVAASPRGRGLAGALSIAF